MLTQATFASGYIGYKRLPDRYKTPTPLRALGQETFANEPKDLREQWIGLVRQQKRANQRGSVSEITA
jgi:hypothetical protein